MYRDVVNRASGRGLSTSVWAGIIRVAVAVGFLAILSGSAGAERKKKDPLSEGIEYCRRVEWEKALKFFSEKAREIDKFSPMVKARIFLFLGLSQIHLLKEREGRENLLRALKQNPCIKLPDSLDLSPQIKKLFKGISEKFSEKCRKIEEQNLSRPSPPPPPPPPPPPNLPEPRDESPEPEQIREPLSGSPSERLRLFSWLIIGTGSVTFSTAVMLSAFAFSDEIMRNRQPYTPQGTRAYLEFDRSARERALISNILFSISGALLFTGTALLISNLGRSKAYSKRLKGKR